MFLSTFVFRPRFSVLETVTQKTRGHRMKPSQSDPAGAISLSPSSLHVAFAVRQCECRLNGFFSRVISHVPPPHMLYCWPHSLKPQLQMHHEKGQDNDRSSVDSSGLFPAHVPLCVVSLPCMSSSWTSPSIRKSTKCQPHSPCFLPLEFRTYAHPRQMQRELLHTETFPTKLKEALGLFA